MPLGGTVTPGMDESDSSPDARPDTEILVDNGARQLTLDELGRSQPGMARLMVEIGNRAWKGWYAAEAGNWPLARWQLNQAAKLLDQSAFVRPKYQAAMADFLADDFQPLRDAVKAADWEAFTAAFDRMVTRTNHYHEVFGKGFIRWKLPSAPPLDLELTPPT